MYCYFKLESRSETDCMNPDLLNPLGKIISKNSTSKQLTIECFIFSRAYQAFKKCGSFFTTWTNINSFKPFISSSVLSYFLEIKCYKIKIIMHRDLLENDRKVNFSENDFSTLNEVAIEHKRKIKPTNRR